MIRLLPLFAGLVPVMGILAAYLLNAEAGVLPSCMPLLEGCTSISSTGRHMPGSMVFRAVLLPQAAILVFIWWVGVGWLKSVAPLSRVRHAILACGIVGAVALVLYVTYLGSHQLFYEFMKRFGIYFYFLGTALAQILMTWAMPRSSLRTTMLAVIGTPFALGLINLAQKVLLTNPNNIENRIEWISALLMQVWFVLLYLAWRRSGLALIVRTDLTNDRH
jgi:hypothetical protein